MPSHGKLVRFCLTAKLLPAGRRQLEDSVSHLACSVADLDGVVLPRGPVLLLAAAVDGGAKAALWKELAEMRLSALKRRALSAGLSQAAVEGVDDCEDPRQAILDLLIESA